jgi:ATP-binding cassette subfamily B protein
MKTLLYYLSRHKGIVAMALLMAIINQAAAFADPLITGKIVDHLINKRDSLNHAQFVHGVLLMVGLALLAVTIARLANNYQDAYTNMIVKKTGADCYADGLKHAMALPYFEFGDQSSGATLGILTKVRVDIENFVTSFINIFFMALIGLAFVVVYSLSVNYKVTLIYIGAVPVIVTVSWFLSRRMKPLQESILAKTSHLSGETTESLHNIELVKSLGLTDKQTDNLNKHNYHILDLELIKIKLARKLGFVQGTMVNLVRSGMIVVLLFLIYDKELSAGQYFTFLLYSMFLFNPLQELGKVLQTGREAQVSLNQLTKVLNKPFETKPETPSALNHIDCVQFDQVSFSYGDKNNGLKNISFEVKSGETIAFVGPSGSGKSTIVKLMLRLYSPNEGKIYYNSTRARELNKDDIRVHTGIVTQDTQLFSGTIRDNLLFVNSASSDEDCLDVLNRSACQQILERSDKQLYTLIGESGMKLSGGERQRLAIARALLRKPDILIFDEATSALDSITEEEITKTMKDIACSGEHMTILIAHRLSTIKYADRIYVLEDGGIVESGNHQALLDQKGLYYAMWRQQVGKAEAMS